jgi:CheY-like chemotaxis protein
MNKANTTPQAADATKRRVLVVEDEYLVALLVEDMLGQLGYEVKAIASNLAAATEAAQSGEFDVAILDVNLNGALSSPVADILAERSIPFIFATGYGRQGPHERFTGTPALQKPFEEADLARALSSVLERAV